MPACCAAKTILRYMGQSIGTPQQQRTSGFQLWMQNNQVGAVTTRVQPLKY
jgi:hypothetical protein